MFSHASVCSPEGGVYGSHVGVGIYPSSPGHVTYTLSPPCTDILWWPPKHVRLASGWYASYWNAFLFKRDFPVKGNRPSGVVADIKNINRT